MCIRDRRVCEALRDENKGGDAGDGGGPWLQDLVRGEPGGVALEAPKRPPRNPELEARCQKLRDEMEQREYDEMTKDVTGMGRRGKDGGLKMSTLTRELGFGAHVITVMGACFAAGVVTGKAFVVLRLVWFSFQFESPVLRRVGSFSSTQLQRARR